MAGSTKLVLVTGGTLNPHVEDVHGRQRQLYHKVVKDSVIEIYPYLTRDSRWRTRREGLTIVNCRYVGTIWYVSTEWSCGRENPYLHLPTKQLV